MYIVYDVTQMSVCTNSMYATYGTLNALLACLSERLEQIEQKRWEDTQKFDSRTHCEHQIHQSGKSLE